MEADFREALKAEYLARVSKRPKYSQRAFARDLKVSPGFLNLVFSNKKRISPALAYSMATRLMWDEQKTREFMRQVLVASTKNENIKAELQKEEVVDPYLQINVLRFKLLSQWYHFAIMELTQLPDFESHPHWIANKIAITPLEAQLAIQHLLELNLLKWEKKRLVKSSAFYEVGEISSDAIRHYHKQILEKAALALYEQSPETRNISSLVFGFDKGRIAEAKKMINDFQKAFLKKFSATKPSSVYHFNLSLFRVDRECDK
jgi:uncharacterized protein (TIGR02147 family)